MKTSEAAFYTIQSRDEASRKERFLDARSREFGEAFDQERNGFGDVTLAYAVAELIADSNTRPLRGVGRARDGAPMGQLRVGEEYGSGRDGRDLANDEEIETKSAAERRAFYLRRMETKGAGAGSAMEELQALPREDIPFDPQWVKAPYAIVGGWAASRYAPPRMTQDVDVLVTPPTRPRARESLAQHGEPIGALRLHTTIGLEGESWRMKDGTLVDILATEQRWGYDAVRSAQDHPEKVVGLPWLVLMKMDSARGKDQGDLTNMLGLADDAQIEAARATLRKHLPQAMEELDSYIAIGKLEMESAEELERDGGR